MPTLVFCTANYLERNLFDEDSFFLLIFICLSLSAIANAQAIPAGHIGYKLSSWGNISHARYYYILIYFYLMSCIVSESQFE